MSRPTSASAAALARRSALRLVEQARVLERHAHARRDRRQQAHLGFAEGVLALVVLEDDRAEEALADERSARTIDDLLRRCRGSAACPSAAIARRSCSRPRARASQHAPSTGRSADRGIGATSAGARRARTRRGDARMLGRLVAPADADVAGVRTPRAACRRPGRRCAWKSSSAAMPCWMLLITASSALRCSVSFSRRCVSSNRRAFSSATPMLAATVCSRRTSASPKAFSRS